MAGYGQIWRDTRGYDRPRRSPKRLSGLKRGVLRVLRRLGGPCDGVRRAGYGGIWRDMAGYGGIWRDTVRYGEIHQDTAKESASLGLPEPQNGACRAARGLRLVKWVPLASARCACVSPIADIAHKPAARVRPSLGTSPTGPFWPLGGLPVLPTFGARFGATLRSSDASEVLTRRFYTGTWSWADSRKRQRAHNHPSTHAHDTRRCFGSDGDGATCARPSVVLISPSSRARPRQCALPPQSCYLLRQRWPSGSKSRPIGRSASERREAGVAARVTADGTPRRAGKERRPGTQLDRR